MTYLSSEAPSTVQSEQILRDRQGQSYRLSLSVKGDRSHFQLYWRQTLVGEARCLRESPERMAIGDIAIANEVIPPPANLLMRGFRQLPGCQHPPVNYRGRGLGTALLRSMIEHSRQVGAKELCGEVFEQDVQNCPVLLSWYERQGFERQEPQGELEVDVVALICLAIA